MRPVTIVVVLLGAALAPWVAAGSDSTRLLVCAPGYPSDTEGAQPTMDDLSAAVAAAAGASGAPPSAVYHSTLEGGLEVLEDDATGLALVPLPFYLEYREQFELRPLLRIVQATSPTEQWSLVARRGAVAGPSALDGWRLVGLAGYAPEFVRKIALADWGELPQSLEIRFTSRMLGALRKAAGGENVALLLDRAQTEALASLPFADDLEVVARSRPLPGSLLCRVGDRMAEALAERLVDAFGRLDELDNAELLETMRISRFEPLAAAELEPIERAFDGGR